jgi:hypothetical protein
LAAAEFGDRCDPVLLQISIRCAPVARMFHHDDVGEQDDAAEVVVV